MKVYLLALTPDAQLATNTARALEVDGHAVTLAQLDKFPIADALSHRLTSASQTYDFVIALLRSDEGRETWVAAEMATQSKMQWKCRFALMGANDDPTAIRLATFARGNTWGLCDFVRTGIWTARP
jgi:hypothetical protein